MFTDPEPTHSQGSKNVCHAYGSYHESKCHIFRGVYRKKPFFSLLNSILL